MLSRVFYVAVIFAGYLSVKAAPIVPGDVRWVEPQHYIPSSQHGSVHGQNIRHPVVVVGPVVNDHVPVVPMTSSVFPADMQRHVATAALYTQHTPQQFTPNSQMAVGNPVHVHVSNLHHAKKSSTAPVKLAPADIATLQQHVAYIQSQAHNPNPQHGQHPGPWHPQQQQQQHPYHVGHNPYGQHQVAPVWHPLAQHPPQQYVPHPAVPWHQVQQQHPYHVGYPGYIQGWHSQPQHGLQQHPQGQHWQGQHPQYPTHSVYHPHGWPHQ